MSGGLSTGKIRDPSAASPFGPARPTSPESPAQDNLLLPEGPRDSCRPILDDFSASLFPDRSHCSSSLGRICLTIKELLSVAPRPGVGGTPDRGVRGTTLPAVSQPYPAMTATLPGSDRHLTWQGPPPWSAAIAVLLATIARLPAMIASFPAATASRLATTATWLAVIARRLARTAALLARTANLPARTSTQPGDDRHPALEDLHPTWR